MFDYGSYYPAVLPMRKPGLQSDWTEDSESAHIPQELTLVTALILCTFILGNDHLALR